MQLLDNSPTHEEGALRSSKMMQESEVGFQRQQKQLFCPFHPMPLPGIQVLVQFYAGFQARTSHEEPRELLPLLARELDEKLHTCSFTLLTLFSCFFFTKL